MTFSSLPVSLIKKLMDKSKGFECDESTKAEFSSFLKAVFSAATCLVIETPEDPQSPMDMYLTARTQHSAYTYAFELKERDWRFPSDKYGRKGQNEGWVLEDRKIKNFEEARSRGYKCVYVNFYPDGVLRLWNLDSAPEGALERRGGSRTYHLHTVDDEGGTYTKAKVELFNDWAKDFDRYTFKPIGR